MLYTTDQSRLNALIERALETEEIKHSLGKFALDREILRKSLLENANQVWEAAAKEIAEYDIKRRRIEKLKSEAAPPAFLKPLIWIYRLLRSVLLPKSDVDAGMREELEIAKSKADEAVIRFGIIPRLRSIINEEFWKS